VRAYRTDLLERNEEELAVADGRIELHFGPFEITTVRWIREA
jgi:hypothetical protein